MADTRRFHHIGIPTSIARPGEVYLEPFGMYVSGFETSPYGVEWLRFAPGSPLPELVQSVPHVAFEVDDVEQAIAGHDILIAPNRPSEGVRVAFIVHNGAPVEFLQFDESAPEGQVPCPHVLRDRPPRDTLDAGARDASLRADGHAATASDGQADAGAFRPHSVELTGGFVVAGPIDRVFALFSPLGERLWVPGWDPELLHPPGASWERGLIFRTQEESGEAVWVVTRLDLAGHEVEYHRVEPGRYVARITVACGAVGERSTEVRTAYRFVGLSTAGNDEIDGMSDGAYREKMRRWDAWISGYLSALAT